MYAQCILTTSNKNNVIGTELTGEWKLNLVLTNDLCPSCIGWYDVTSVSFSNDLRIVDALPIEDFERMIEYQLFLSGKMTLTRSNMTEPERTAYPYVLSSRGVYQHLVYWQEEMTTETFNLMMARAADKKNDLLSIFF
jgi:hypothetical protein